MGRNIFDGEGSALDGLSRRDALRALAAGAAGSVALTELASPATASTTGPDNFLVGTTAPAAVYRRGTDGWEQVGDVLAADGASVTDFATHDGTVYAALTTDTAQGDGEGRVAAFDGENWTTVGSGLADEVTSLAAYDGSLFAGVSYGRGRLYRYDGGSSWTRVVDRGDWQGVGAMEVFDGRLYLGDSLYDLFGYYDGSVFVQEADRGGSCVYDFAVHDGELYASAYSGILYERRGGDWDRVLDDGYEGILELESYAGDLYLGLSDGRVRTFDPTTGARTTVDTLDDSVVALSAGDGPLYAGSGQNAAEFEESWRSEGVGNVYEVSDDAALVGSVDQFAEAAQAFHATDADVAAGTDLRIEDVRVVQAVENTRFDESQTRYAFDDGELDSSNATTFPDPPLVAGKSSAVVFDVTGEPTNLPRTVTFELTRYYNTNDRYPSDDDYETVTFTVDRDVLEAAADPDESLLNRVLIEDIEPFPLFELDENLTEVAIRIADDPGVGVVTDVERDVVDMPELNVGFVGVQNDKFYGTISSTADYDEFVRQSAQHIQRMFPTRKINVVKADLDERYREEMLIADPVFSPTVYNAKGARQIAEDAITDENPWVGSDDDSFAETFSVVNGDRRPGPDNHDFDDLDVVLGVVPESYFENVHAGSNSTTGIHYGGDDVQPTIAALVEMGTQTTATHEAGHHFLGPGFYEDRIAQVDGDGSKDNAHSNDDLVSTEYDLGGGTFETSAASPSVMSYAGGRWIDAVAYAAMVEDGLSPTPREGGLLESSIHAVFAVGRVDGDDLSIVSQSVVSTTVVPDIDGADGTATVLGADGDPIGDYGFEVGIRATTDDGTSEELDGVFATRIPFPDEAARVSFAVETDEGTVETTIDPATATLRDAIEALPSAAFGPNERGVRRSLHNRLDAVGRHVDGGRYASAANVMESVRDRIDRHVDSGYDSAPARVYGKSQLLEMLSFRIGRFRSLADRTDGGRGNGQGAGGGRSN